MRQGFKNSNLCHTRPVSGAAHDASRFSVADPFYLFQVILQECEFTRNRVDGSGGAIYVADGKGGVDFSSPWTVTIKRCLFEGNGAELISGHNGPLGGAIFSSRNVLLEGSTFEGNFVQDLRAKSEQVCVEKPFVTDACHTGKSP